MTQVTRSETRTCDIEFCQFHRGRWKRGDHVRCLQRQDGMAVFIRLGLDGSRDAHVRVRSAGCWSGRLPLPARPRKVHAVAVATARRFVREGVLAE